ncbi:hypothetical protein [Desulfofundulus thermocisternus]|uniref:hypothetical protein n=1 Tax=Desulfofundulus thermocisternus TaxID=42471 RepID=UPI00217DA534|nr:hypothetical protein [Desulfofundulus thermocisternus]MCS5696337.1 hypothetical protein [Desulfofundulus thermocisternus]
MPLRMKLLEIITTPEQWNPEQAENLFREALERAKNIYVTGSIPWAEKHHPELVEAITEAEQQFDRAYRAGDMAGCRKAAQAFERAIRDVVTTYREQQPLTADEVIRMFDCGKAWNLTGEQAQVLDTVFASPLPVVEVAGKRWYSPEGWRDNYQPTGSAPRRRRTKCG